MLILSAAIPNLVLLAPVIRNMIDGLGLRMAGPLMITVTLFLVVILPVLAPLVANTRRRNGRGPPSQLTNSSAGWTKTRLN